MKGFRSSRRSRYTVSEVIAYLDCPRKYYLDHVVGIPRMASALQNVGSLVHRAIEISRKSGVPVHELSFPSLFATAEDHLADLEGTEMLSSDCVPRVIDALLNYSRSRFALPDPAVEESFVEQKFNLKLGAKFLHGKIDRLDRRAGGLWEIIDFKLGSSASVSAAGANYLFQLTCYAAAVAEVFQARPQDISCILVFLGDGVEQRFAIGAEEIDEAKSLCIEAISRIERAEFGPAKKDRCFACEHVGVCT